MMRFVEFADRLSAWFGKSFAWAIMVMTLGVGYEVVVRRLLNAPTSWAFDVSYIMYGTLFMMGGAYTLSRNGHVRGDFVYRLWKPRTQAIVEFILYILFFFPGVTALVLSGWKYASRSWAYGEVSVNSPAGVPIFQFKTIIVAAGILLFVQGIAQMMRCVMCMRDGHWTHARDDVEETEVKLMRGETVELMEGRTAEAIDVVAPTDEGDRR
ncbi:MAG: TRAP transporter small permease subunit [Rhodospirillaceae bacterium]|jgi:TRAP-type mannitol/chloroaromatic compound transport system permease small subunit|nr:TRAP transporter small permease subunit [Rhodospirillaceae bacterium]